MTEDASGEEERSGFCLVVAPEGPDRDWATETLDESGLTVYTASEAEVLATPDLVPPRLVVLDDAATRAERNETLRRLSGHVPLKGVPVLVLSYDADIESYTDALTKGVSAFLVKPVNAEELVAVAHRLSGWTGRSDKTEKRRRIRRPLVMKVEVDLRSRKRKVPGQIVDVSGSGCRVEMTVATGEPVEKGETVRIVLQGHDDTTHVTLGAEVRWYRLAPDGTHVFGAHFTGTTALLAAKVLGFVSSGST